MPSALENLIKGLRGGTGRGKKTPLYEQMKKDLGPIVPFSPGSPYSYQAMGPTPQPVPIPPPPAVGGPAVTGANILGQLASSVLAGLGPEPMYGPSPQRRGRGRSVAKPITWAGMDVPIAGAPEWWSALAPSEWTPESEYATLANLMLPFLSPEDQRTTASHLFSIFPEGFGHLDPEMLNIQAPVDLDTGQRARYTAGLRGRQALGALERMLQVSGKKRSEFGPGYGYLRQLADVISDFGGEGMVPTRMQALQQRAALDPLLAQAKTGPLEAWGPLARQLTQPFFSARQLRPQRQLRGGQTIPMFNPAWF